jgi:hypothetical protein
MFLMPGMVIALYTCGQLDKVRAAAAAAVVEMHVMLVAASRAGSWIWYVQQQLPTTATISSQSARHCSCSVTCGQLDMVRPACCRRVSSSSPSAAALLASASVNTVQQAGTTCSSGDTQATEAKQTLYMVLLLLLLLPGAVQ